MIAELLTAGLIAQGAAANVHHLKASAPDLVVTVDGDKLGGRPTRLAWAPNGSALYLRIVQTDVWGNERAFHFRIDLSARRLEPIAGEPSWFAEAWERKSALSAQANPKLLIAVETRQALKTATGGGSGGSLGQNVADPSLGAMLGPQGGAIVMNTMQSQQVTTTTMRLKGHLLGEFVNTPAVPGLTYGWAPGDSGRIAFVNEKKHLVLMDPSGEHLELADTRDVLLPAWSPDASRVACIQRRGKNGYAITLLGVPGR